MALAAVALPEQVFMDIKFLHLSANKSEAAACVWEESFTSSSSNQNPNNSEWCIFPPNPHSWSGNKSPLTMKAAKWGKRRSGYIFRIFFAYALLSVYVWTKLPEQWGLLLLPSEKKKRKLLIFSPQSSNILWMLSTLHIWSTLAQFLV